MKNSKHLFSSTKNLVILGVFIALGTILMLIEIPYPIAPFLRFDLSELIVLLTVEVFGLIPAITVALFKSLVYIMLGMSVTPMHIGSITAFIASSTIACLYFLTKRLSNKLFRVFIIISSFTAILTLCNYLFITPIYFGELSFLDVRDWVTLNQFIPGLPFNLGYGAAVLFTYIPFNMIKGLLVLGVYQLIAPRLLEAIQRIVKIHTTRSIVSK